MIILQVERKFWREALAASLLSLFYALTVLKLLYFKAKGAFLFFKNANDFCRKIIDANN